MRGKAGGEESEKIFFAGAAVAALVLLVFSLYSLLSAPGEKNEDSDEGLPRIRIVQIKNLSCSECNDLGALIVSLTRSPSRVENEVVEHNSSKGAGLVAKYGITKLPSMVVTGDVGGVVSLISAWNTLGTREADGALVLRNPPPPFFDLSQGRIVGLIELIQLIDSSCVQCSYVLSKRDFEANGVVMGKAREVEFNSREGIELVVKYNVTKVPVFLLSPDISLYPKILPYLRGIGSFEGDGWFVQRRVNPVYRDLREGRLRGLFSMLYVYDKRCAECPGPGSAEDFLKNNFGMKPAGVELIEADEERGMETVSAFNLSLLPAFVLSGDLEPYEIFWNALPFVGFEGNGSVVLTNYSAVFARTTGSVYLFDAEKNESTRLK